MIVGNRIGTVPEEIPKVPLQVDFERNLKVLRLKLEATSKVYHLDLRKELVTQEPLKISNKAQAVRHPHRC